MIYIKKEFCGYKPGYFHDERNSRIATQLFSDKGRDAHPEEYYEVIEAKTKKYKLSVDAGIDREVLKPIKKAV